MLADQLLDATAAAPESAREQIVAYYQQYFGSAEGLAASNRPFRYIAAPPSFGALDAETAYGVLDGVERLERFTRLDDGTKEGYADIRLESVTEGKAGTVDLVPPYDIHAEQGGPYRSVAVILRSERVAGKVLQGRYDPAKKTTHKGEGPTQVPFEVA